MSKRLISFKYPVPKSRKVNPSCDLRFLLQIFCSSEQVLAADEDDVHQAPTCCVTQRALCRNSAKTNIINQNCYAKFLFL